MKLGHPLTISQIAKLANWDTKRMKRHLFRLNAEVGGMLLRNTGTPKKPCYTATLEALQRVAPQWFVDDETIEARLGHLEEVTDRLLKLSGVHTTNDKKLGERIDGVVAQLTALKRAS